jgi:hypothetical protein
LIERGFDVEVYEAWLPSGKTRRIPVPGNATLRSNGMCNDLLGEHGFRFFRLRYSFGQATAPRVSYGWISFPLLRQLYRGGIIPPPFTNSRMVTQFPPFRHSAICEGGSRWPN